MTKTTGALRRFGVLLVVGCLFATSGACSNGGDSDAAATATNESDATVPTGWEPFDRGALSGGPRIARHLWRMCFAFFICEGSFAAQPKAVPEALHGSSLVIAPGLAALVLMVAWLIRLQLPRGRFRPRFATS